MDKLFYLLRFEALTQKGRFIFSTLAALGFSFLMLWIGTKINGGQDTGLGVFWFILIFGGIFFSSGAFKDIHDQNLAFPYQMLPASNEERYIAKWISSFLGFALVSVVSFGLSLLLTSMISKGMDFNPQFELGLVLDYCIIHSLFFSGGLVFKKHPLLKTMLILILLAIIMMVLTIYVFTNAAMESTEGLAWAQAQFERFEQLPLKKILWVVPIGLWASSYVLFKNK